MDNPYSTSPPPQSNNPFAPAPQSGHTPLPPDPGYIGQVPVIGWLMIVQGILEIMMGIMLSGMGTLFAFIDKFDKGERPLPENMRLFMMIIYGALGLLVLVAGGVRIAGGIGVLRHRWRKLALVANIIGFGSAITCYCGPSAIGLGIYGLIVLMHPSVIQLFQSNKQSAGSPDNHYQFGNQ